MTVTSSKINDVEGGITNKDTSAIHVESIYSEAVAPVNTNQVGYDAKAVNVVVLEPADAPDIGRQSKLCCRCCCDVRMITTLIASVSSLQVRRK